MPSKKELQAAIKTYSEDLDFLEVARRNIVEAAHWPHQAEQEAKVTRLIAETWRLKLDAMLALHNIPADAPDRWERLAQKIVRPEEPSLLALAPAGPHGPH